MSQKKSYLTATDQFCGAGGSSSGATAAGVEVRLAMNQKKCKVCEHTKDLDLFYERPSAKDGYRSECKECTKDRATKSAKGRVEERAAYMTEYEKRNRAHLNKRSSERARANRRHLYHRRYRASNIEKILLNERKYRAGNRHKETVRRQKRRLMGMEDVAADYIKVLLSDPCCYCGNKGGTVDHIVPVAKGGDNSWDNLTSACKSCNSSKNADSLLDYIIRRYV